MALMIIMTKSEQNLYIFVINAIYYNQNDIICHFAMNNMTNIVIHCITTHYVINYTYDTF